MDEAPGVGGSVKRGETAASSGTGGPSPASYVSDGGGPEVVEDAGDWSADGGDVGNGDWVGDGMYGTGGAVSAPGSLESASILLM